MLFTSFGALIFSISVNYLRIIIVFALGIIG